MQRISWLQAYGKDFIKEKTALRNVKRRTSEGGAPFGCNENSLTRINRMKGGGNGGII